MPPKRYNKSNPLDILEQRISALEKRVQQLETQKILTVPTYDNTNLPTESIEGQVAIIFNS